MLLRPLLRRLLLSSFAPLTTPSLSVTASTAGLTAMRSSSTSTFAGSRAAHGPSRHAPQHIHHRAMPCASTVALHARVATVPSSQPARRSSPMPTGGAAAVQQLLQQRVARMGAGLGGSRRGLVIATASSGTSLRPLRVWHRGGGVSLHGACGGACRCGFGGQRVENFGSLRGVQRSREDPRDGAIARLDQSLADEDRASPHGLGYAFVSRIVNSLILLLR